MLLKDKINKSYMKFVMSPMSPKFEESVFHTIKAFNPSIHKLRKYKIRNFQSL
jgi:hypothetical protein